MRNFAVWFDSKLSFNEQVNILNLELSKFSEFLIPNFKSFFKNDVYFAYMLFTLEYAWLVWKLLLRKKSVKSVKRQFFKYLWLGIILLLFFSSRWIFICGTALPNRFKVAILEQSFQWLLYINYGITTLIVNIYCLK